MKLSTLSEERFIDSIILLLSISNMYSSVKGISVVNLLTISLLVVFNSPDDDKLSYKFVRVLRFSSATAETGIVDISIIIEKNNAKDFLIVFICIPPNFI